jgi:uncharacterized protein (TIGR00251 family)
VGPLKARPEGTEVEVWVVPGASRSEIAGIHDGALRVRITAAPEGGKANKAIEALLSKATGGAKVRLLAGFSSRRKRLLVAGLTVSEVSSALGLD